MYSVIVVDDEKNIRNGLSSLINNDFVAFNVIASFGNGKEAIAFLEDHDVDIVITDIKMPIIDGIKLAQYIHQHKPHIKVVFLSGYADFSYARQAISLNVKYYISKPTNINELTEVLDALKVTLDNEYAQKAFIENKIKKLNELIHVTKAQFFESLLSGKFAQLDHFMSEAKRIDLTPDYLSCRFFVITMQIIPPQNSLIVKYNEAELFDAIYQHINKIKQITEYIQLNQMCDKTIIIARSNSSEDPIVITELLNNAINEITNYIKSIFMIQPIIKIEFTSKNAFGLNEYKSENIISVNTQNVPKKNHSLDVPIVRSAKEYIAKNYMHNISLYNVADHVRLNPDYFSRFFKRSTGMTFVDYLTDYRMNKAIELFKEKKYKIYTVSEMCGYTSSKYFAKVFKKHTSYTPTEYCRTVLNWDVLDE